MAQEKRTTAIRESVKLAAADAAPFRTWGDMHRLQVAHMLGAIPVLGERFVYADLPTAGSRQTVFKTAHGFENMMHSTRYGSQSRHLSDLSDLDSNWFVLLGGNDGWIGSANFMDQVDLWQKMCIRDRPKSRANRQRASARWNSNPACRRRPQKN